MRRLETFAATLFGVVFVVLSVAVAVETLMRKLFNVSLQGVDELGGYSLAVGGALAFTLSLLARAHIRIDLLHDRLPRLLRAFLNLLAYAMLAATAVGLVAMGWISLRDSISMNSTAQTPWATPLRYPQAVWVATLALFALAAAWYALRALWLGARGRGDQLDIELQPKGTKEELKAELEDLRARGVAPADSPDGDRR